MEKKKPVDGDLLDSFVIWTGRVLKNGATQRIVAMKLFKTHPVDKREDYFVRVVVESEMTDAVGSKMWSSCGTIDNYAAECALAMLAKTPEAKSWLKEWFDPS